MIINTDGTLKVYDGPVGSADVATGTWTLTGQNFKATYHYVEGSDVMVNAVLNPSNLLTGTWGFAPSNTSGGSFTLTKQ
ncbi:hypothetical protein [Deinococcus hopiensis]|nr:hypothetical protein [Deinococcus hopiensis]